MDNSFCDCGEPANYTSSETLKNYCSWDCFNNDIKENADGEIWRLDIDNEGLEEIEKDQRTYNFIQGSVIDLPDKASSVNCSNCSSSCEDSWYSNNYELAELDFCDMTCVIKYFKKLNVELLELSPWHDHAPEYTVILKGEF